MKVSCWDLPTFASIEIEDNDKVKYRYAKKSLAPAGATLHVDYAARDTEKGIELRLVLVHEDRMPVLRQDEPGLPDKMVVQYEEHGWLARYEYEQVRPVNSRREE